MCRFNLNLTHDLCCAECYPLFDFYAENHLSVNTLCGYYTISMHTHIDASGVALGLVLDSQLVCIDIDYHDQLDWKLHLFYLATEGTPSQPCIQ